MTTGCAFIHQFPRSSLHEAELVLVLAKVHKFCLPLDDESLGNEKAKLPIPYHCNLVSFLNDLK
jgi:hypothetical protein